MKKLALALAATAAFAGQAIAADMPVKAARPVAAPVVVANWTGCYLAGGVGYGMYDQENVDYFNPAPAARFALSGVYDTGGRGWLGRGQVGCDYQFGGMGSMNVVVGVFGDYDWADIKGRFSTPGAIVATETLKSQWAVGGRIGLLVTPQLLTYFSGGYTEATFGYGAFTTNTPIPAPAGVYLNDLTYKGWFLGSGLEYALNWAPGLTVKTEYRFSEFDVGTNRFYFTGTNIRTGGEIDSRKYVQTVMTSLSYKFSFGGGAVVAKY